MFRDIDAFSLRYLSEVRLSVVSKNPFVASDTNGPDTILIPQEWKILSRSLVLKYDKQSIPAELGSRYLQPRPIMGMTRFLLNGNNHTSPRKSDRKLLPNKGTTIVVIECRKSCLSEHQGSNEFLIPFQVTKGSNQTFACIRKDVFPLLHRSMSVDEFNLTVSNNSLCSIDLRSYHLSDYEVGLLFLYRENASITKPTVTSEYRIQYDFDHEMLDGIVLSHWHTNPNFMKFKKEYLETVGKVYPKRGFGSRPSANSDGINVYTGIKSSNRAIGNPFSDPSLVPFDQLWSSKGDITYHPVVNKIINAFTTESSRVMNACTSLLHCFIEHVYRKKCPQKGRQFHNFRGFNNLSILTAGSTDTKTDGFYNTIHTDVNDCLDNVFQQNAMEILTDLKKTCPQYLVDDDFKKGIAYLEKLSIYCKGFATPTTCGYTIIDNRDDNEDASSNRKNELDASFAMVGLGVSVRIDSNDFYHTFFGSAISHCTAVPVTIDNGNACSIFTGKYNIVGWGSGSSKAQRVYDNHFREGMANHGNRMTNVTRNALIAWLMRTNLPDAIHDAEIQGIHITP